MTAGLRPATLPGARPAACIRRTRGRRARCTSRSSRGPIACSTGPRRISHPQPSRACPAKVAPGFATRTCSTEANVPMPADAAPAIVARQATKLFLDGAVVAFRQLSLAVNPHEILCVVGPSGCGKTTFLRAIAGLTDLSSGELSVGGKLVAGPPDGVAMVFQHFGLLPWKTVYDNAAFGLAMARAPAAHIKERVAHYLELVGLAGFEHHYPYQLSGGMQQRVGL